MLSIAVIVSVLATIAMNGLANALPIYGQTTAEISNRYDTLFTPAGYVFAIWGLIYLGLLALAVYQALPGQRDNPRLRRARGWIALSGLVNIVWLLLWHSERFPLTMLFMLGLLATLIVSYQRLEIGRASVTAGERWLVQLPIGIYLGWICVATIANASVLLVSAGWDGWGLAPEAWTMIVLAVALVIGWLLALRRGEVAAPLVLVWAFAGIAARGFPTVTTAAWAAAALAGLGALAGWRRGRGRLARPADLSTT